MQSALVKLIMRSEESDCSRDCCVGDPAASLPRDEVDICFPFLLQLLVGEWLVLWCRVLRVLHVRCPSEMLLRRDFVLPWALLLILHA